MSRDWTLQLEDIRQAISRIRKYLSSLDYDAFTREDEKQDAVIRNLEIIGETSRALPEGVKAQANDVEWRKIAALRNLLIHEYFGVSLPIIWDIAHNKLEALDAACKKLLDANPR